MKFKVVKSTSVKNARNEARDPIHILAAIVMRVIENTDREKSIVGGMLVHMHITFNYIKFKTLHILRITGVVAENDQEDQRVEVPVKNIPSKIGVEVEAEIKLRYIISPKFVKKVSLIL